MGYRKRGPKPKHLLVQVRTHKREATANYSHFNAQFYGASIAKELNSLQKADLDRHFRVVMFQFYKVKGIRRVILKEN